MCKCYHGIQVYLRLYCSCAPRIPKCTVLLNQTVLSNDSGVDSPSNFFWYNIFISSSVRGCDFLGLFPFPCFFNTFCLADMASRVRLNTSLFFAPSPRMVKPYFILFSLRSTLLIIDLREFGSYSPTSFLRTVNTKFASNGSSSVGSILCSSRVSFF